MTGEELDALLDAYFEGRLNPEQEQELSDYVEEHRDRAYPDFCGIVVSEDLIPDYDPDSSPHHLTKYLDPPRIEKLEQGEEPTEEEVELFRAAWLHWACHSPDADADVIPAFLGVQLDYSDGRSCYGVLLIRGFSFSGVQTDFHGLFRDREAVLEYLRFVGHIDAETGEPATELIDRARASSRRARAKRARPHPVETRPPERFEKRYLRDSSQWDRLTAAQFARLLRRSLLHYGLSNDTSLIGAMADLMRRAVRDLPNEHRAAVYREVAQAIENNRWPAFYAFIPVVVHEPQAPIAATATIDFVSMSPMMPEGKPAGFYEAVTLLRNGTPESPGGVFGGLVSLGDERFRPDLDSLKSHISARDVQAAARCESESAKDAQIRFWLEWAEELMPLAGDYDTDHKIGSVASALARIRKRILAPTVIRAERLFPAHHYDSPVKVLESWSVDEYARLIAPRLYALEDDEPPPKAFSTVLEIWGLSPRARKCDRLSLPPVC
jgi:hypothetical protein